MRASALAAAFIAASFALASAAHADPWTDRGRRFTFEPPEGWIVEQRTGFEWGDTVSHVVASNGANQCQFLSIDNGATAMDTPGSIRARAGEAARFTPETWSSMLNRLSEIFPDNSAQIESTSVDTSAFWPIQRARARAPMGLVQAAVQLRPGIDIVTACVSTEGEAPAALFDQIIRAVGHPSDAIMQMAAESEAQMEAQNAGGGGGD